MSSPQKKGQKEHSQGKEEQQGAGVALEKKEEEKKDSRRPLMSKGRLAVPRTWGSAPLPHPGTDVRAPGPW